MDTKERNISKAEMQKVDRIMRGSIYKREVREYGQDYSRTYILDEKEGVEMDFDCYASYGDPKMVRVKVTGLTTDVERTLKTSYKVGIPKADVEDRIATLIEKATPHIKAYKASRRENHEREAKDTKTAKALATRLGIPTKDIMFGMIENEVWNEKADREKKYIAVVGSSIHVDEGKVSFDIDKVDVKTATKILRMLRKVKVSK